MLVDNSGNPIIFCKNPRNDFDMTRVGKLMDDFKKITEDEKKMLLLWIKVTETTNNEGFSL